MADPLDNANEVLQELEAAALHTSAGSYVRMDHVRKLLSDRKEAREEEQLNRLEKRPPKSFAEARKQVKQDEEIMKNFPDPNRPREPGRSVSAHETQPSSRT